MKQQLRSHFKQIRKNIQLDSKSILKQIEFLLSDVKIISIFYPLPNELNCLEVGNFIQLKYGIELALPVIDGSRKPLQFCLYDSISEMRIGKYNILEPKIKQYCIPQLMIVPLLAFDPLTKHRLGNGGGYYDRTIKEYKEKKMNCTFVGLGHEQLKYEQLPFDIYDQKLDYIVTNEYLY